MKNLLLFFALFISFQAKSQTQDTASWSPAGATWVYGVVAMGGDYYLKLQYEKDTILQNKTVKKMNVYSILYDVFVPNSNGIRRPDVLLRQDFMYKSNDTVYTLVRDTFRVLYVFSAQVGDSWEITETGDYSIATMTLPTTDTVLITGISVQSFNGFDYNLQTTQTGSYWGIGNILNNIGSLKSHYPLINPNLNTTVDGAIGLVDGLVCYYDQTRGYRMFPYHFRSCAELTLHSDQVIAVELTSYQQSTNDFAHIFPNPTSGELVIQITAVDKISNYEIFVLNNLGQLLTQKNVNTNDNTNINLTHLPAGHYLLRLQSGLFSQTFKIVKL